MKCSTVYNTNLFYYLREYANYCDFLQKSPDKKWYTGEEDYYLAVNTIKNGQQIQGNFMIKKIVPAQMSEDCLQVMTQLTTMMQSGNSPLMFPNLYGQFSCDNKKYIVTDQCKFTLEDVINWLHSNQKQVSEEWLIELLTQLALAVRTLEIIKVNYNKADYTSIGFQYVNSIDQVLDPKMIAISLCECNRLTKKEFVLGRDMNVLLHQIFSHFSKSLKNLIATLEKKIVYQEQNDNDPNIAEWMQLLKAATLQNDKYSASGQAWLDALSLKYNITDLPDSIKTFYFYSGSQVGEKWLLNSLLDISAQSKLLDNNLTENGGFDICKFKIALKNNYKPVTELANYDRLVLNQTVPDCSNMTKIVKSMKEYPSVMALYRLWQIVYFYRYFSVNVVLNHAKKSMTATCINEKTLETGLQLTKLQYYSLYENDPKKLVLKAGLLIPTHKPVVSKNVTNFTKVCVWAILTGKNFNDCMKITFDLNPLVCPLVGVVAGSLFRIPDDLL